MAQTSVAALLAEVERAAPAAGCEWLKGSLARLQAGDASRLHADYVAASRRLGRAPVSAIVFVDAEGGEFQPDALTADTAARLSLLLSAEAHTPSFDAIVDAIYRQGDSREKEAVLRALPLLGEGKQYLEHALDAGRTNEQPLFAAIALDNPFPARHYPELEFNKLVMKTAFVRLPIGRIWGLSQRANRELSRMAMEYIDEQEAAGRRFAPEVWLAIANCPVPGALGRMLGYAAHASVELRLGAARGLAAAGDPRTVPFIEERLQVESHPEVRRALEAALGPSPRGA